MSSSGGVQASASRQYHLVSSHQSPPSGIILLECDRIPHSQQETTPARRAPLPFSGGRRVSSAMTSPPVDQPRRDLQARPWDKRKDQSGPEVAR